MFIKKRRDHGLNLRSAEATTVARAFDGVKMDADAGLLQRVKKQLALIDRHGRILVAMHDEERRIVPADKRDRTCAFGQVGFLRNTAAQQLDLGRIGARVPLKIWRRHKGDEIRRPIVVANRLHAAGLVEIGAHFECLHVATGAEQRDKMSAS